MIGRRSHICIVVLTLALGSGSRLQAQSPSTGANKVSFDVAPVPSWVKPIRGTSEVEAGTESAGTIYLLVDRQQNLERSAFFYHEVRKITSENGVQNGASISTSFDPTFERLIFHSIQLTRNGVVSNRLDRARIKLLPSEKDPDRFFYDPSYAGEIVLDDVRVGDVIEFAYTTEGANPVRRGKYSSTYLVQWTVPIVRNVLRLVYPANRKITVQARNGAIQPTVTTAKGTTEIWYDATHVPGRQVEDDVPDDYSPVQRLELSEFSNWAEVAQWAIPLFEIQPPRSGEFSAEMNKLRAIIDPERRVVAALQFVQDEIRYVSFRSWFGARRLTAPDEVLRRRSANNMDKALLLVALLRGTGIDAAPALVSEAYRGNIRQRLPSGGVFDHAIVQVQLGQGMYWVDPSRGGQRGPLPQIFVARFDCALVLRPGSKELVNVSAPPESLPVKKVVETYRVPAPDNAAELDVISEYRGLAADRTRASFRENTREEIQKRYLNYYTRSFPEAKPLKLVWYEELSGENACRVTESYVIPKIWQLSEEKDRYVLALQPGDIYSALGSTTSPQREDPLKLDYPNTVVEEINVEMFEEWPFSAKGESVTTDFFRLRDEPAATGSHLQLNYSFELVKDRVEVSEFPKFNSAISKAKDSLGYTLRYSTPDQLEKSRKPGTFNWAVGAAGLCFLSTSVFVAYRYFRDSKLSTPRPPPIDTPARLTGIGGWLILLAIGHVVRPISYIKTGFGVVSTMLGTNSWRSLTDPIESSYHPWWAPTLLFELFFNIACLVFCALLIALFFTKRAAWPRCFAIFLIVTVLGSLLDTLLVDRIPAAAETISVSIRNIVAMAVAAAIWIPYVYLSKRVKATFRY